MLWGARLSFSTLAHFKQQKTDAQEYHFELTIKNTFRIFAGDCGADLHRITWCFVNYMGGFDGGNFNTELRFSCRLSVTNLAIINRGAGVSRSLHVEQPFAGVVAKVPVKGSRSMFDCSPALLLDIAVQCKWSKKIDWLIDLITTTLLKRFYS